MISFLEKQSPSTLLVLNFGLIVVFGVIDYLSGEELSFYAFYFIPIIVVTWYLGKRIGVSVSFLCLGAWFLAKYFNGYFYSTKIVFAYNLFFRLFIFLAVLYLIVLLKTRFEKLKEIELKRQNEKIINKTAEEIVALISEHITLNNSEIIRWINRKKESGHQVPKQIEDASNAIGESLELLTKICYSKNDNHDILSEYKKHYEQIIRKMDI